MPNRLPGFGVGIEAGDRNLWRFDAHVLQRLLENPDHLDDPVRLDQGHGLGQADVVETWITRSLPATSIMREVFAPENSWTISVCPG